VSPNPKRFILMALHLAIFFFAKRMALTAVNEYLLGQSPQPCICLMTLTTSHHSLLKNETIHQQSRRRARVLIWR